MRTEFDERESVQETEVNNLAPSYERRWDLAFIGILGYVVVEYMRLSAQYPIFQYIQIGKVIVAIAFLGWLFSARCTYVERSPVQRLDFALVSLLFAAILSTFFAFDKMVALSSIADLLRWLLIYFLIGRILNSTWRLRMFVLLLLLLNFKMAQFGIRGYSAERAYGRSAQFMASQGSGAGSQGFFGNAGDFGVAMCVMWPLAALLIWGEKKLTWRVVLYIFTFTFIGAIFTSSSRGALVTLVLVAMFGWVRNPKRIIGALLVGLVLLAAIYLMPEANKQRLMAALHPQSDPTAYARLVHWKAGLEMFAENPVLGVGLGNYPSVYAQKYADILNDPTDVLAPHSIYIESLSELGVVGTLAYALIVLFLWRLNVRTRKYLRSLEGDDAPKRFEYRLSQGIDLGLLGFLISGAFLTVLYYPHLWVLAGLSAAAYSSSTRVSREENAPNPQIHEEVPWSSQIGSDAC